MIDAGQSQSSRGNGTASSLGVCERLGDRLVECLKRPLLADGLHVRRSATAAPEDSPAISLFGQQCDGVAAAAVDAKDQVWVLRGHSNLNHKEIERT